MHAAKFSAGERPKVGGSGQIHPLLAASYQNVCAYNKTQMATSTSTARGLPAPPIARSQQALIHESASLTGTHPITVGADAIIQLRAKIISAHGPVTIGDGCVVAERAVIGLASSLGAERGKGWGGEVILGNGVIIESGAAVEGKMLGEGTIVEVGAVVGRGSVVGKVGDRIVIVGAVFKHYTYPFSRFQFLKVFALLLFIPYTNSRF